MNYVEQLHFSEECFRVVGICMKIHSVLGKGFKEVVYKDALEVELQKNQIPYQRERKFVVMYDGLELRSRFIADFVVFEKIVVEVKAVFLLDGSAFRQILNYLKVADIKLGLLINFGEERLKFQRIIN